MTDLLEHIDLSDDRPAIGSGSITFDGVTKCFGETVAVDALQLDVHHGEFLVIVGPSGCGKTTALRMVAGLERPTSGRIHIGGRDVTDLRGRDRDLAMVFQSYALYPHLTVADNIGFGLRQRKVDKAEIAKRVAEAARMLELEAVLGRRPGQLSGGQRQRVALGRAVVRRTDVLLMDEPLSNLDAQLRQRARIELSELHARLSTTTLYVTHDQVEAMTMGHRVAVMKDGVLQQCAPPNVVYNEPANAFVASFIGSPSMNMLPARIESSGAGGGLSVVAGGIRRGLTPAEVVSLHGENDVVLGLRAEHVEPRLVSTDGHTSDTHRFTGRVRVVEPLGSDQFVTIDLDGLTAGANRLTARLSPDQPVRVGDQIAMRSTLAGAHLFAPTTGRRLLTFEAPQDER